MYPSEQPTPWSGRRRRSRVRTAVYVVLVLDVVLVLALLVRPGWATAQGAAPGAHAFLAERPDGSPVTWDPCSPIGYVVNWDLAPPGALALWTGALRTVEEATGLEFEGLGSTRVSPVSARATDALPAGAEVLVSWVSEDNDPRFAEGDSIAWARALTGGGPGGRSVFTSGQVSLDAGWFAERVAAGDTAAARAVLLHELGHLVGLDHVDDPTQLMDPATGGALEFQQGDLEGLARLGPVAGPVCS